MKHRETSSRQTEHHDREEARHEGARSRIAREEAMQVARHRGAARRRERAEHEPRERIQDVMQARDEQQAVQQAEHECADRAGCREPVAGHIDRRLHRRPCIAEHDTEHQTRDPGDNRHKALAAEEREILGQLDVLVPVVQHPRDDPGDDPRQHAHIELVVDVLHHRDFDEVADRARQRRDAVVVLREADCDADREQQRQVVEDRAAGVGDHLDVEHVGLSEPQQQPCDRQHRDRQHQRATEPLNFQKRVSIHYALRSLSLVVKTSTDVISLLPA